MADLLLHRLPDHELEAALRGLAPSIAWPSPTLPDGTDIAASVRARLEASPMVDGTPAPVAPVQPRPTGWRSLGLPSFRPARRAFVLALAALAVLAAIAGAAILGLPGLQITLGPVPSPSATASAAVPTASGTPGPLGSRMPIGQALELDRAAIDDAAGFEVLWPEDARVGGPDAVYFDRQKGGQITTLWATSDELPATLEPSIGLLLSQFRGTVDDGFFRKVVDGGTPVERVEVNGQEAYWISGDPHVFFWEGVGGFVDDARRWVGDVLIWADGPITYRLETALGRDAAIQLAEAVPLR